MIDFRVCCRRRHLIGMSRKTDTLPLLVVCPAMIGTDERTILNLPQREPCATVQAEVAPRMDVLADTPQHDIFLQQSHRNRFAFLYISSIGNDMPVIKEYGVIEHKGSFRWL